MWLLPPVLLLIIPGSSDSSADIMGPEAVRGPERGSLTVQCHYVRGWEPSMKFWCRGADFNICRVLVRTAGPELSVKERRMSIRDNQSSQVFTVTMEKLRQEDADTYWCGIERPGLNHGVPVRVIVGPDSPDSSAVITGPEAVRGPERGSLTLQCRYVRGWESSMKFWCRGADLSICRVLVRTTGSELSVKERRMSIRDNQSSQVFTVTMEKLRQEDADTYWCGTETPGLNHGVPVRVIVGPVPLTTEVPTSSRTVSGLQPKGWALLSSVHFLLLVFLKLPVFLIMLAAVLWVNRPQRGPVGGGPPHSENQ